MEESEAGPGEEYCESCGAVVKKKAEICPECGVSLNEDDSEEEFRNPEKTGIAALTHVLAYFTWIIGPLVVYATTDDDFVKRNAANALNWQFTLTIYMIISGILMLVLVGIFLILVLGLLDLVFIVMAAIKASDGEAWEYPITIDFL